MKRTNTWIRLHLFQKLSLLGLVVIGISLPVSMILSAYETRVRSKAAQEFSKTQMMHQDDTINPRLKRVLPPPRFVRYPLDVSVSGSIKPSGQPLNKGCVTAGCSGELCVSADQGGDIASTCEWKESYTCLRSSAICEQQPSGSCGWTYTDDYYACLNTSGGESGDNRPKAVCGNGICEQGEADKELCTRSLPPQCRTISGTCSMDCTQLTPQPSLSVKPTTTEVDCTRQCAPGFSINAECTCVRQRYEIHEEKLPEVRERKHLSACEHSGGETKLLSGCGDSCAILTDSLVACPADSQQESCDCGPNQCWDGNSCVKNPKTNSRDSLARFGFSRWFSSFFELFQ